MKLFLCSSFITAETRPAFEQFANISSKQFRIACITTASRGYIEQCKARNEKADISWLQDGLALATAFGYQVDTYDICDMTPNEFNVFDDYDAIWMEGGVTGYLINQIRERKFEKKLLKLIEAKLYIGTSAGSMICSKSLDASEWYIGDPEKGISRIPGLGLINFQIYPHFEEELLPEILKRRHPNNEYWLLKNGQSVMIENGVVRTIGGNVTILTIR